MSVVIASAVRTPFGRFGGALKDIPAVHLGALVMEEALNRVNLAKDQVDEVIFGHVLSAGMGQIPARQAAIKAGIPVEVPALSINKVCASGLRAVTLAYDRIKAGGGEIILAGGMESMSQTPFLAPSLRLSKPLGHRDLLDGLLQDGLTCPFEGLHMGALGDRLAEEFSISREEQDAWSYRSHQRAIEAMEAGRLREEILPVKVRDRRGREYLFSEDESPRKDTSLEALRALSPVFTEEGSITPGNAPGINDGAGALLLMSTRKAEELGITPLGRILDYSMVAQEPDRIATVPALAAEKLLKKNRTTLEEIDGIEINEAFAAVVLISTKMMGWDLEKVNTNGGAIALGHPIGVSGARILMTLLYQLRREGLKKGLATLCSGTAQGDAILVSTT